MPPFSRWLEIWNHTFTHPEEFTFTELAAESKNKTPIAFQWIFWAGLIGGLLGSLLQFWFTLAGAGSTPLINFLVEQPGLEDAIILLNIINMTLAPLVAIIDILLFGAAMSAINNLAGRFGGKTNLEALTYSSAAHLTPAIFWGNIVTNLPVLSFALFPLIFYAVFLQFLILKAVLGLEKRTAFALALAPALTVWALVALVNTIAWNLIGPSLGALGGL